jgi:hypothetical protein
MPDRRRSAILVLMVVAACGAPTPSVAPKTDPTPASAPEQTSAIATVPPVRATREPPGTPEQESLPTTASVQRRGIRLTIQVSPNPLEAGHPALARVTIENVGKQELRWINDGCDTNAGIIASVDSSWRESDLEVQPELVPYRQWLRSEANVASPISLSFRRGLGAGRRSSGCADVGLPKRLRPGGKVSQEFLWHGYASPRLGKPPSGPAKLSVSFECWSRPGPGPDGAPVLVELDSWIRAGRGDEYLSPAEAIDAALADERLASWLLTRPLRSGADAIAEYDTDLGVWVVGLLTFVEDSDPVLHAAFLDAITGEVIAIREHHAPFS